MCVQGKSPRIVYEMWKGCNMWKEIDRASNRITYAAQLGPVGCLVLVVIEHSSGVDLSENSTTVTSESSTITFVPGIAIQVDSFGKWVLNPLPGYGQTPTDLSTPEHE